MPAYNEAGAILGALDDVAAAVLAAVPDAEVVVVDDGSTDGTRALLEGRAAREPRLRVVSQANGGHGPALRRGLDEARGEALLLLDSDRQVGLEGFAAHWAMLREGDLVAVLGVRRPRHDPRHRLVISAAMRGLLVAAFGRAPRDAGVPYKLLRRAAWEEAAPLVPPGSFIPSVLTAVILLRRHPGRVREVVVRHVARDTGATVLRARRLARFCARALAEVMGLRRALAAGRPLAVEQRAGRGILGADPTGGP